MPVSRRAVVSSAALAALAAAGWTSRAAAQQATPAAAPASSLGWNDDLADDATLNVVTTVVACDNRPTSVGMTS